MTEDIWLIPNRREGTLELWEFPEEAPEPPLEDAKPSTLLELPKTIGKWAIQQIACRAEPNPIGRASTWESVGKPHMASPEQAIVLFQLHLNCESERLKRFAFMIHRKSLLRQFVRPQRSASSQMNTEKGELEPQNTSGGLRQRHNVTGLCASYRPVNYHQLLVSQGPQLFKRKCLILIPLPPLVLVFIPMVRFSPPQ